jgi:hypothetical protein
VVDTVLTLQAEVFNGGSADLRKRHRLTGRCSGI